MSLVRLEDFLIDNEYGIDSVTRFVLELPKIILNMDTDNFMDTAIQISVSQTQSAPGSSGMSMYSENIYICKPVSFKYGNYTNALQMMNQMLDTNFTKNLLMIDELIYGSGNIEDAYSDNTYEFHPTLFVLKAISDFWIIGDDEFYIYDNTDLETLDGMLKMICPRTSTPTPTHLGLVSRTNVDGQIKLRFFAQGSLATEIEPETIEIDTGNSGGDDNDGNDAD